MILYFLTLLYIFSLVTNSSGLKCYFCDPMSQGNCRSPDKNNITVVDCQEMFKTANPNSMSNMTKIVHEMGKNSTESAQCYTLHISAGTANLIGHYRGCLMNDMNADEFCEQLNIYFQDEKLCRLCSQDQCNSQNIGGKGKTILAGVTKGTNGGVPKEIIPSTILFAIVVNFLYV